jgi:hypothetical protein
MMTKPIRLEVGDTIKVVANPDNNPLITRRMGMIGTIVSVDGCEPKLLMYDVSIKGMSNIWFLRKELRLIKKVA